MGRTDFGTRGLLDYLASGWTLLPGLLAGSALIVGWGADRGAWWPYFYAVAGVGGAAALVSFVTQWAFGKRGHDPELTRYRQQLVETLDALEDGAGKGQAVEAQLGGTPAATER